MKNAITKFSALFLSAATLAVCAPAVFADEATTTQHTMIYVAYQDEDTYNSNGDTAFFLRKNYDKPDDYVIDLPATLDEYGDDVAGLEVTGYALLGADDHTRIKEFEPGTSVTVGDILASADYQWHVYDNFSMRSVTIVACVPGYVWDDTTTDTTVRASASESPAAETPAVDTRTEQQKQIDEAKANGTWGSEYTTCTACGTHNWTHVGEVYVCDNCGHETTSVKGPDGVKGYVGSTSASSAAQAAPQTRYASAAEAQAAADQREAAYAAAIAALQRQVAMREAAYAASIRG